MSKTSSQARAPAPAPQIAVKRRRPPVMGPLGRPAPEANAVGLLADELGALIDAAQQEVAMAASAALTTLHWRIGHRIRAEILGARRGQLGAGIVVAIGAELGRRYGRGYGEASLRQMIRFAERYPQPGVVRELERRLSWSHFKELMLVADPLRRGYYAGLEGELTPALVLREATMLDFLGLGFLGPGVLGPSFLAPGLLPGLLGPSSGREEAGRHDDLERAVLSEVERCLVGPSAGFSLVERKKSMGLDGEHRDVDLLMFHRKLRRLVAVQLELGEAGPSARAELERSLRWLDRHERQASEQPPIGILLRATEREARLEYVDPCSGDLHTGRGMEELPGRLLLEECIERVLSSARERAAGRDQPDRTFPPHG